MKKIYSIFAVLIASLVSMVASAKVTETRTVRIHIDDMERISTITNGDSYDPVDLKDQVVEGVLEVSFVNDTYDYDALTKVEITTIPNAKPVSLKYADGTVPLFEGDTWGDPESVRVETKTVTLTGYDYFGKFGVLDDTDLYLVTEAIPEKIFTIEGDHITVKQAFGYNMPEDVAPIDGVYKLDGNAIKSFNIYAEDGYLIKAITTDKGKAPSANMVQSKTYIYAEDYEESTIFTVETIGVEDARTSSFTLKVANVDDIKDLIVKRAGTAVTLEEAAEQTIKFNPVTETGIAISRVSGQKIYNAKHTYDVTTGEGDDATTDSKTDESNAVNTFSFTATNGSVVEVNPEFPDVDVPVHFSFTNEGTEGSITGIKVNGVAVEGDDWRGNDFTVKLSDKIELIQNATDYEFTGNWISVNGTASKNASFEVLDDSLEDGYNVVITSRKYAVYSITIECDAWKYISANIISKDPTSMWGAEMSTPIVLTGKQTEASVSEKIIRLELNIKSEYSKGFTRVSVTNKDTDEVIDLNWGVSNGRVQVASIKDGMTMVCNVTKQRKDQAFVYLHEAEWTGNGNIYLDYDGPFEEAVALENGYNTVTFGVDDFTGNTFSSIYVNGSTPVYYLNGEQLETTENDWKDIIPVGVEAIKANDVLKIYADEPTPVKVTYTIAEGVNVSVAHDYVTAIDEPSEHSVLPGTMIHITPLSAVAELDDETTTPSGSPIKVTVNGQPAEAGEDGVFAVSAKEDSNIKVEKNDVTAISEISADKTSTDAFDLQGRRVAKNTKGLVISNGKLQIRK